MNIEATKIDLVQRLLSIEDEEVLNRILAMLDMNFETNPQLTQALQAGLEDIRDGRVYPHEDVRKLYEKWLQK
jgi:hypothetical protein